MAVIEVSEMPAQRSSPIRWPERVAEPAVVSVVGDQDVSNQLELAADLARSIGEGDGDVVIDLRAVTFMGASTVGVLAAAHGFLLHRDHQLILRSPSRSALRVLDLCGLSELVEEPGRLQSASRG